MVASGLCSDHFRALPGAFEALDHQFSLMVNRLALERWDERRVELARQREALRMSLEENYMNLEEHQADGRDLKQFARELRIKGEVGKEKMREKADAEELLRQQAAEAKPLLSGRWDGYYRQGFGRR